ncbi:MAG: hypothetical protein ACTSYB_05980 [Candidatus Helarchaeota archaeon]
MGIPDIDKLKDKEKVAVLQQRIQFQNETIENQKAQINELKAELTQLKEQLDKFSNSIQNQTSIIAEQQRTLKDQESTILEQQMSISQLQKQLIELQNNLENANKQLQGMEETIRKKTEQLKTENIELKTTLDEKQKDFNKKIEDYEETIKRLRTQIGLLEQKEKELNELREKISASDSSSLEKRILDMEKTLEEADATITKLEKELQQTKQNMEAEINVRDVKIQEYEHLLQKEGIKKPTASTIITDKDIANETIKDIFSRTKSNVMIFLPDINFLENLDFDSLRPIIRVHLAVPVHKNMNLINQLKMKPNVEIRDYTEGIIWGIIRDNEELMIAPIGENNEPSGLVVKGDAQIDMFGTIIRSTWTRLKRF